MKSFQKWDYKIVQYDIKMKPKMIFPMNIFKTSKRYWKNEWKSVTM